MPKLWKKTLDTTDTKNLEEVDLSTLKISSPTVIFISGRETTDKNRAEISKSIHFLNKIYKDQPKPPQIYSWSHSRILSRAFNMAAYHLFPGHRYRPSAGKLAKAAIMPLVSAEGRPLPPEEAKKNLRNLTLLGYSAGSLVAQEVFNASLKMMQKTGYTPEEARTLLNEVVLVTIGTISRPTKEQNRFTTITLVNTDDTFVRAKNFLMHPFRSAFRKAARQLRIEPLSGANLLISAAAGGRKRDMLHKKQKEVMEDVQLPRWSFFASNHEARDYVNEDYKHSQVSWIVPNVLINAANRKTTLEPLRLLEPPASLGEKEKALYQDRIAKAQVARKGQPCAP